jgi:hypothetical protein
MHTLQESGGNRTLLQFPSRSDTLPVTVQYDSDSSSDDSSTISSHSKSDRKRHHKQHNSTSKPQTTLLRPLSGFGDAWRLMTTGNSHNSTSNQHAPHDSAKTKTDDTNGETPADIDDHADTTTTATVDATGSIDNDSSRAVLQTSKTCVIS